MTRQRISSGSQFEELAGYSRAVADGDWVFVAGTTGFDYEAHTISDDVVEQTHQTFRNIATALEEAGSSLDDVVRVQYTLAHPEDFKTVAPLFGDYFHAARPAATAVVAGFVDPKIKIEIEVTAKRQA
ncbi:MAG: RidA family protein [Alphaproteobacteria bacterium]|nr:RidA family protein [Alphaproteobacteria bacterium]